MCGRYAVGSDLDTLLEEFGIPSVDWTWNPRYNIAPTQDAPVVVLGKDGRRRMGPLRWGLVPFWSEDAKGGAQMINARSETVATRPAFREAYQRRRCLVPSDGFYEWRREGGRKIPHWIHRPDGRPFAFAGLWEKWVPEGGTPLYTFTILTTAANDALRPLHDRMPVIVPPSAYGLWLDRDSAPADLNALLRPAPDGTFVAEEVSTLVNAVANDDPRCIQPVTGTPASPQGTLL